MLKNTENVQQITSSKLQKSSSSFFRKSLIFAIVFIFGAACAGGLYYAKARDLQQQITDLQQKTADFDKLSANQKNLEQRLALLENKPSDFPQIVSNSAIATDSASFDEIKQTFTKWLEQKENTLNSALQKIQNANIVTKPQAPEVLLAAGSLTVQDIAERGLPFEYEAEVLQILARNNLQAQKYTDTIRKFANSGITGAKMLIEDFNSMYATLNDMPVAEIPSSTEIEDTAPQKWYQKIWPFIKKIAVHRKKMPKPEFNADKDEVYTLVNQARFAEALNKMKTDSKYNSIKAPMLEEWQKQAESYIEFESAMQALIMNALANIRLKEMQR